MDNIQNISFGKMPPGPDRAKERSKTFPGIAKAMAKQWAGEAESEE